MDVDSFTCRVPGCDGPRSGVCINNLSFDECPDVIQVEEITQANDSFQEVLKPANTEDMVITGGQSSLDASSCDLLLRSSGGVVVGIVAGPDVGKTTMIATIYELAYRGRLTSLQFAGSETLRGYEERCHLARMASNRMRADTPRTPTAAKLSFTHLKLLKESEFKDIIFSDRSGEHFDNVLNRPSEIKDFHELARADVILLLIDIGQIMSSPHLPTSKLRRLFMAMDANLTLENKVVKLIGTKADLAGSSDNQRKAISHLEDFAADLNQRAVSGVVVESMLIASRPEVGSTLIGDGLEELLLTILQDKPSEFKVEIPKPPEMNELDALMIKYWNREA